ncbi:MAG TPA: hypothetical protein VJ436_08065 [Anaerolineales bacterium]|nr:hypothetical protein [Anaerolineales bacterium]
MIQSWSYAIVTVTLFLWLIAAGVMSGSLQYYLWAVLVIILLFAKVRRQS